MPEASDAGAAGAFVDTNIWVYAHLKSPGDTRHERALALVQGCAQLVISPQVVAEYYSVMLRNAQSDAWIQANLRAMFAAPSCSPPMPSCWSPPWHCAIVSPSRSGTAKLSRQRCKPIAGPC